MKIRLFTWRFFLQNAGYATPPGRAVCALELARAEQWAEQEGIEFRVEDDPDADDSFVETWPLRYQKAWKRQSHSCCSVICYRPCPEHGWECKHKEVLASLGGIFDPTDDYLRVVRAELASEAMHTEVKAWLGKTTSSLLKPSVSQSTEHESMKKQKEEHIHTLRPE